MQIEVRGLKKSFGQVDAVQGVSFEIEKGKLIGLLGPSGGGKTTVLRMLAGLEAPTGGDILFEGRRVNDLPPQERGIGFVFQNYALFKHMNVFDNIAFGLQVQKVSKRAIKTRVQELVALTGLGGLEKRFPHQLSGGQRQRVAFARALAPQPQLLLLDEPFAAIDAKVRRELRTWLKDMIARVGVTSIFVTHDQEEAVEVADELLIMNQGRLEQKGTPWTIYKQPKTSFVASFIGDSNRIEDPSILIGFDLRGTKSGSQVLVRPEAVEVGREAELSNPAAAQRGKVKHVHFRGTAWQVDVEIGSQALSATRSLEQEPLQPGEDVLVLVHRLYLFQEDSSRMLENDLKSGSNTQTTVAI